MARTTTRKSTTARATTDSRQASIDASNEAARVAAENATPLEEVLEEAQAKGYLGRDASDRDEDETRAPVLTGVQNAPGGHPNDPTTRGVAGGAS